MSDLDRLKEVLRRSARDGTTTSGRIRYGTGPDGVARMLEQVDAAVLAQRLSFEFDDGSRFICEALGRRLVRLLAPPPRGLTAEQVALFDRDDLGGEEVRMLSDLFITLCERGSRIAVTSDPLGDETNPSHVGIEPAAIARAAGLSGEVLFETKEGSSHEALLDALQPSLRAAILIEGEEATLVCGEGAEAGFVTDWADNSLEDLLSPKFPLLGTLETNGILVFALPKTTGNHLLIAGRHGSLVVATVRNGDVTATLDRWRELNLSSSR
ncbi:hypothetical protein O2N63_01970 [Aliiroseovarius sp. KMU-50]|uniref:DUF484 family protein n=1 Tax=Aliiroseovarius salicola TaxID=3009082 RepID=A0ABT4VX69_9RHOB|nr:hypothetical protein [Aliiroseovarius sp. KMU-50]MDA5092848.1 hypothetical protein [Aliiroseovarius sp. KMU-50]